MMHFCDCGQLKGLKEDNRFVARFRVVDRKEGQREMQEGWEVGCGVVVVVVGGVHWSYLG